MRINLPTIIAASILAAAASTSALARSSGGGDREPAGGAFNTSYPEQGSTGIQMYGPPRSVDIPRPSYPYQEPGVTGSIGRAPQGYYGYPYRR